MDELKKFCIMVILVLVTFPVYMQARANGTQKDVTAESGYGLDAMFIPAPKQVSPEKASVAKAPQPAQPQPPLETPASSYFDSFYLGIGAGVSHTQAKTSGSETDEAKIGVFLFGPKSFSLDSQLKDTSTAGQIFLGFGKTTSSRITSQS